MYSVFVGKEVVLLMQALNTLATPEEKLAALCKMYADLVRALTGTLLYEYMIAVYVEKEKTGGENLISIPLFCQGTLFRKCALDVRDMLLAFPFWGL